MIENNIPELMRSCRICPRNCGADRTGEERGLCGASDRMQIAGALLHMWEEPCISGSEGSGTIFFAGCSLGCVYCQNSAILDPRAGRSMDPDMLAAEMLWLQNEGANNINLVTAAHYLPQAAAAVIHAKQKDLRIPVVYNSSGYEKVSSLCMLEGLVDIYLPDLRYFDPLPAARYSGASDYPETAKLAIREMVRQAPRPVFDERGMLKRGVIVRILLLPGHVKDACRRVDYLYDNYGDDIYISLLSQFTPMPALTDYPEINRTVTRREYERLVDHAISKGVTNAYIQEGETASESFIPAFTI